MSLITERRVSQGENPVPSVRTGCCPAGTRLEPSASPTSARSSSRPATSSGCSPPAAAVGECQLHMGRLLSVVRAIDAALEAIAALGCTYGDVGSCYGDAMAFERFEKRARPVTKEATVTLQRSGAISFNRVAWEAMGKPEAVELLFDPDTRRVGMQATDESAQYAYTLHGGAKRQQNTYLISGKAFTQYYEIDVSRSIRRIASIDDGMLVISLDDPGIEVTSNRGRRSSAQDAGTPVPEVQASGETEGPTRSPQEVQLSADSG